LQNYLIKKKKHAKRGLRPLFARVFFVENSKIFFKNFAQPLSGEKICNNPRGKGQGYS